MNLNQVRYLLAIHETGSIRQAADNLFISAPSISTAIKNLEDELGCPLLTRHHNGVSFTEEGEEAILLMKELEDIINKLHHLRQNISLAGEVSIGVSLHVKASLFLPTLLHLRSAYPGISVKSTEEKSRDILRDVIQGRFNLGMIHYTSIDEAYFLDTIAHNHLTFSKLFEGQMIFVVHEDHPLTKRARVTMADLLQYPFLNYYKTDFTKEHHKALQHHNPDYRLVQTDDRDMYRDLLHNSNAVTIMPELNEQRSLKQFTGLAFIHAADLDCPCTIGWIHSEDPLTRVEEAFIDVLKEEVKNGDASQNT
ncbi:MAG: LysR family transcriptional regulator [Peptococcaceae bacterium]|nr:LysR family transcriptional regulator [Peptococcaceae bacterium]